MSTYERKLHAVMARNKIVDPELVYRIARKARLPLSSACALLTMESGGGRNVFGHDPTSSIPARWRGTKVTRAKYAYYKLRRARGGMQGVGPAQLTWWETQDQADRLGGCWRRDVNMLVGFKTLAANITAAGGVQAGFARYNGAGPAADAYGRRAIALQQHFHTEFARVA